MPEPLIIEGELNLTKYDVLIGLKSLCTIITECFGEGDSVPNCTPPLSIFGPVRITIERLEDER